MSAEPEILLETHDLVRAFGSVRAVDGLDLEVRAGEMIGLVGPDGAGKTTTMRLLCGALQATRGTIRVAGYEIPEQVEKAREEIGYLAQRFSLYGDLTAKENLEFFGEVFDLSAEVRQQRSQELLRFAGLEEFADRRAAAGECGAVGLCGPRLSRSTRVARRNRRLRAALRHARRARSPRSRMATQRTPNPSALPAL